jgi:hypothetical protein
MKEVKMLTNDQALLIQKIAETHGHMLRRKYIKAYLAESGHSFDDYKDGLASCRNKLGVYDLQAMLATHGLHVAASTPAPIQRQVRGNVAFKVIGQKAPDPVLPSVAVTEGNYKAYVPEVDPLYVPFGHFSDIKNIVKSGIFYPFYVAGMSGNGKTFMIEQACAAAKREYMRVNFTKNTDEEDLFGGFRLINGETVWFDGPVIKAMRAGALLLLDEIDLSSANAMCLQPVLEGKPVLLKKINEQVKPAPGFNIAATANTKGKGCDDGRFVGTNVLNEAFLERYPLTFEQEYPPVAVEKKILAAFFESQNIQDDEFVDTLTSWSAIVRMTFKDGGLNEVISTRRLVHIANAYVIFQDKKKAIELCISRFDEETKNALMKLYDALVVPKEDPALQAQPAQADVNLDNLPELEEITSI